MVAGVRASWLAALEVADLLPERTVLVRNEAVAHSWRRDLVAIGRTDLLAGTRFVTTLGAATAIVDLAGTPFTLGEEAVRPARIRALLAEPLTLVAFDLDVLRERPGWERAIASTIGDLESAGQDPATLRASGDPRCLDLAEIWSRLDRAAGTSWTAARLLLHAASLLEADPSRWPYEGPCLAEVTGHETTAFARFLRATPRTTLVHLALRPQRSAHARRLEALFGEVPHTELAPPPTSERAVLASYVFAPPEILADPARSRSASVDGSVQVEEHAGVEEELDAAVSWVIGEVAERQVPLEQIAIVVPRIDPYASLLIERFEALGPDSVFVMGGLPATATSSGARMATVLRALAAFLHIDTMVAVLPILRLDAHDVQLSRRDAIALLYELGTVGGSLVHRAGASEWLARSTRRHAAITSELAAATTADELDPKIRDLRRKVEHLGALTKPLEALDRAARVLIDRGPLGALWGALRELFGGHVRLGTDGQRLLAAIDLALAPIIAAGILDGEPALEAIITALEAMRLPVGRFGEARITIVALGDAVGLSFRSVRIMGLAEGVVPASVREDPVLPDHVRSQLGLEVRRSTDRALAQLRAIHRVVLATSDRVALSAPRMDIDGSYREPSGILMEVVAALGRQPLGPETVIPDGRLMRQIAYEPARQDLAALRARWPVDDRGRLTRAARDHAIPESWRDDVLLPLARLGEREAPDAMDGWFPEGAFLELPGLSEDRPISASALARLLECPHRFLYERVLGWNPPPALVEEGSIDALAYGSLFHETAERFYRDHGAAFCTKATPIAHWKERATAIADERFERFVESYPLVGTDVRAAQRSRLQRDLLALLDADWATAKTFVDVERAFGPMPVELGGETVHVRGYIDRIDTLGATTLVRDLKTGRAKAREKPEDLRPAYDIQLGLYGHVTRTLATEWDVPATIEGSYVYPADSSGDDRSFVGDFDVLAAATERWVGTAVRLLKTRRFPRTPIEDDCQFCSFKPVCGAHATTRARALVGGAPDLAEFAAIKLGDPDDE